MCKLKQNLSAILLNSDSQKPGNRWEPTFLEDCDKRCKLKRAFGGFFSTYLGKTIVPSIDQKSYEPIWEEKYTEESQAFSEVYRITEHPDLSMKEKVTLIKVPKQDVIDEFIRRFFTYCDLLPEVITLSMIYLHRFLKMANWQLRSSNWRILVLIAVRIAQKNEGYKPLTFTEVSELYPLYNNDEISALEVDFLRILDYNCFVSAEEYSTFVEEWTFSCEEALES